MANELTTLKTYFEASGRFNKLRNAMGVNAPDEVIHKYLASIFNAIEKDAMRNQRDTSKALISCSPQSIFLAVQNAINIG